MTSIYNTGTITVTNGNAVVTGSGTAWAVALVTGGMFTSAGMAVPIASVTDDTHLVLDYNWPGTTASGAGYSIALENANAASIVDLNTTLSRVLVTLSLAGITPDASGSLTDRDAITLGVGDKGFLFLHAEIGVAFAFYRWTGTAWDGPFAVANAVASGGVTSIVGGTGITVDSTNPDVPSISFNLPRREVLTANRTYYVRTDGNDTNNGLANTSGGALLTLQAALNAAYSLDLGGKSVTIQVADGTYTAGVFALGMPPGSTVNSTPIYIKGNAATPGNVIVSVTAGNCFTSYNGAFLFVQDMELRTTTSGDCLRAKSGGQITYSNIRFGTCAGFHKEVNDHGRIYNSGDYSIVGGANAHEHVNNQSYMLSLSCTVTITGTPAFSSYFVGVNGSFAQYKDVIYSGSATGPRFLVHNNGEVYTSLPYNANYFPGDVAGTCNGGGVIDDRVDDYKLGIGIAYTDGGALTATATVAGVGPNWILRQQPAASASGNGLGSVVFQGINAAGTLTNFGQLVGLLVDNTVGSEDGQFNIITRVAGANSPALSLASGVTVGSPTGSFKGAGTINATAVYDDNVLLTCMALAKEFSLSKTIDLDKWDAMVPDIEIPERVESVPETVEIDVEYDVDERSVDGSLIRRKSTRKERIEKVELEPVWDDQGNGVDAIPQVVTQEITTPAQTVKRIHGTARVFKAMCDAGFDPRDPEQYFAKMQSEEALPGMPTQAEWVHNSLGIGDMISRKWLAMEMLAIVSNAMWVKLQDHEARLVAGGL